MRASVLFLLSGVLTLAACEGAAGKDGAAGADGQDGAPGADGAPGSDGAPGEDGVPGEDGDPGEDGADASEIDGDSDGVSLLDDCDDDDNTIGAPMMYYIDYDGDGYGYAGVANLLCEPMAGWVDNMDDCDDLDSDINPAAVEVCDWIDNDCNGDIDADDAGVDLTDGVELYIDLDADGYGDDGVATVLTCEGTAGYTDMPGDCDDFSQAVNPDAEEICGNGIDDNCNGSPDACGLAPVGDVTQASVTFTGTSGNYVGQAVSVGDFNADGYDDMLIGEEYNRTSAGSAWVVYGGTSVASTALSTGADAEFYGTTSYDYFGFAHAAGDLDGDGYDDVAIGHEDLNTVWIEYGSATPWSGANDQTTMAAGIGMTGSNDFGKAVVIPGDLNGDGIDDLVVGAVSPNTLSTGKGDVFIFFGGSTQWSGSVTGSTAFNVRVTNSVNNSSDYFGNYSYTMGAGDFDGDGIDDLTIGAYGVDTVVSAGGEAYVIMGSALLSGTIASSTADSIIRPDITSGDSYLGSSTGTAGDFNGDGYEELAIGGIWYDNAAFDAGVAAVFYGSASGFSATMTVADADLIIEGAVSSDYLGKSLDSIPDLDGDGDDEFVVSASGVDSGGLASGAVYVFYGNNSTTGRVSASTADITINGVAAYDYLGSYGLTSGDIDGNGATDLLVGAYGGEAVYSFPMGGF